MELITLQTFDNPIDAHILKSKLESEGILCVLFDENVVSLNPLYNVTVGGIKLKINKNDLEKAREVLSDLNQTPFTTEDNKKILCPKCQSHDLISGFKSMKGIRGILSSLSSILVTLYPFYYKKVYKCKKCGTEFKAEKKN